MDGRKTSKIIDNKGGIALVNSAERILRVASSFEKQERNIIELRRVMDKIDWI